MVLTEEYYEYISEEGNITFKVAYIQLEGDIPNLETLNEKIRESTCYYVDSYFEILSGVRRLSRIYRIFF